MTKTVFHSDVLILGGGVVGLSIAWELSRRGVKVCVIDAERIGRGASWAGAGILPPAANQNAVDPYEQLRSLSHRLHGEWASRLREETGVDTGYRRCGGIHLARTPAEAATLSANQCWWDTHGIDYARIDERQLVELEPKLADISKSIRSAWLLPDECQLRNPRHLRALEVACRQAGVTLIDNSEISQFEWSGAKASLAQSTSGDAFTADAFCICAGAWTRKLLTDLGHANGIMPVRGQMVLYQCPSPPVSRVINEGHRYLVPRDDGLLLAGSVEEEVGYVCETTEDAIQQIGQWAELILPHLAECPVSDTWAGLRPGSFDGLPYIGKVPQADNLYVAAGHFRSGLHLSCATAVVVADLITDQRSHTIDLAPFRLARG